jgi:hypothetical protein
MDFLFWLAWGALRSMPMDCADRLMARDYIRPVFNSGGASVDGMVDYRVDITITGKSLIERVGLLTEKRFTQPAIHSAIAALGGNFA